MKQTVKIKEVTEEGAIVTPGVVKSLFKSRERFFPVANPSEIVLHSGEWVEVEVSSQRGLLELLLLFIVPLILVILFHGFFSKVFPEFHEAATLLLSLAGLPAGFLIYRFFLRISPSRLPEVTNHTVPPSGKTGCGGCGGCGVAK